MTRKTNRREFLKGQSAVDALGDLAAGPPLATPAAERARTGQSPETYLLHVARSAMACEFEVLLNAGQDPQGAESALAALDLVEELEAQLTVYRDTSEVMHVNRTAFERAVPIEAGLFALLLQARDLHAATAGAFDVTAGPLIKVWGFYRRQGRMPSAEEIAAALAAVGSQHLELDAAAGAVRFLRPGMELNLGAIGKGYALDRAADRLAADGIDDALLHGGQSSVLARGSRRRGERSGWWIALRHPLRPDQRLAEFQLLNQALGTSGSGTQFFHHQGKRYGHVLDPRTGWPAEQVLAATVIAPTAAEADALATALYVLGLDGARQYCAEHPAVAALLATHGAHAGEIVLVPVNLAAERWRRIEAGLAPNVSVREPG